MSPLLQNTLMKTLQQMSDEDNQPIYNAYQITFQWNEEPEKPIDGTLSFHLNLGKITISSDEELEPDVNLEEEVKVKEVEVEEVEAEEVEEINEEV